MGASVKVVSDSVSGGVRTLVMTRPFQGPTANHFTFGVDGSSIPLITAVGQSPTFSYHKAHAPALIALTSVGSSTCVCDTGADGQLCETGGKNCGQFVKNCVHQSPLNYTGVESGDLF